MNVGKIPENVLKRSILKKIVTKRGEVLTGSAVGVDCACLQFGKEDKVCVSGNSFTLNVRDAVKYAFNSSVNNVAAGGAEPVAVFENIILPGNAEEEDIKRIADASVSCAKELNVAIAGGHTEISNSVSSPVYSISVVGKKGGDAFLNRAKAGDDIVVSKWIGLEGTAIVAAEKEDELSKKFPAKLVYDAKNFDRLLSIVPEAATAMKSGVSAMHDVSTGGIFSALWELAEGSGVGLEIDLKKIPVKQETIEICNLFDINPYEMLSGGCLIMVAEDGNRLSMDLMKEGIESTVIGKCTMGNDRVLYNGENKRYLETPKTDEIYKVIK